MRKRSQYEPAAKARCHALTRYAKTGFRGLWQGLAQRLPVILMVCGCLLLGAMFVLQSYTGRQQNALIEQYRNNPTQAKEEKASDIPLPQGVLPDPAQLPAGQGAGRSSLEDMVLLGVLKIPKINLEVAIGQGVEDAVLRYTVGHFTQTALPGEPGNAALIGHRNYLWGEFFRHLDKLEQGDSILVEREGNTYTYRVTESFVVEPEDTWVLEQTTDGQITLITCTPVRAATHRLIVKGVLEETHPSQPAA